MPTIATDQIAKEISRNSRLASAGGILGNMFLPMQLDLLSSCCRDYTAENYNHVPDATAIGRPIAIVQQACRYDHARQRIQVRTPSSQAARSRGDRRRGRGGGVLRRNRRSTRHRPIVPPACRVITAAGEPDAMTGERPPIYVKEEATWSATRNAAHSYGFASFTVDPGSQRDGTTTINVTYYDVVGTGGQLAPFETFMLRRPAAISRCCSHARKNRKSSSPEPLMSCFEC